MTSRRSLDIMSSEEPTNGTVPNCIEPSVEEFPDDFFSQEQRAQGGVILHFLIAAYCVGMLWYVCKRYFIPSLKLINRRFKMTSDVAGALIMAIGTSFPEALISIAESFYKEDDTGIKISIGSTVFKFVCVTGICGLLVKTEAIQLDWYPIDRDYCMYIFTIILFISFTRDNVVTWYEATIMFCGFTMYVIFMLWFNAKLKDVLTRYLRGIRLGWNLRNSEEDLKLPVTNMDQDNPEINREEELEDPEEFSVWIMPEGKMPKVVWIVMWPANFLLYCTIPNCTTVCGRKVYPFTFFFSMAYIGGLSFVLVWMVAIIDYTLGIPDSVSSIIILAIATSVPELVESIIVIRSGLGNMAVCNLLSSNIFEILVCGGIPWFIMALRNTDTNFLVENSSASTYTGMIVFPTVVLFYVALRLCKWKLGKRLSVIAFSLYIVFVVFTVLYETNILGHFTPPTCSI